MGIVIYDYIIMGVFGDSYAHLYMPLPIWVGLHPNIYDNLDLSSFTPGYMQGGLLGDFYGQ